MPRALVCRTVYCCSPLTVERCGLPRHDVLWRVDAVWLVILWFWLLRYCLAAAIRHCAGLCFLVLSRFLLVLYNALQRGTVDVVLDTPDGSRICCTAALPGLYLYYHIPCPPVPPCLPTPTFPHTMPLSPCPAMPPHTLHYTFTHTFMLLPTSYSCTLYTTFCTLYTPLPTAQTTHYAVCTYYTLLHCPRLLHTCPTPTYPH